MLSIGEFSKICNVSTKTLRYYAKLGLILPDKIDTENGYRYYSIKQLERMLLINRLKAYHFSLEEIKAIFDTKEYQNEKLHTALLEKKKEFHLQMEEYERNLCQLEEDLDHLQQGKSIMSYMDKINVQLVEVAPMNLLSIRKMVHRHEIEEAYAVCFNKLLEKMKDEHLRMIAPPMVLFHNDEFTPRGLDIEFAIPIQEGINTNLFTPGLCLKTIVEGSYADLSSVYTKQLQWAKEQHYENTNALFEIYVKDPGSVYNENELVTEVYYPVKKKTTKEEGYEERRTP